MIVGVSVRRVQQYVLKSPGRLEVVICKGWEPAVTPAANQHPSRRKGGDVIYMSNSLNEQKAYISLRLC